MLPHRLAVAFVLELAGKGALLLLLLLLLPPSLLLIPRPATA
jgi:hypothetical protein